MRKKKVEKKEVEKETFTLAEIYISIEDDGYSIGQRSREICHEHLGDVITHLEILKQSLIEEFKSDMMDINNMDSISVVENTRFVGMILKTRILDLYRRELIMQTSTH